MGGLQAAQISSGRLSFGIPSENPTPHRSQSEFFQSMLAFVNIIWNTVLDFRSIKDGTKATFF